MCILMVLLPFLSQCQGWEPGVLCLLGKPSAPELHPEFLGTLVFSGACLPSCARKLAWVSVWTGAAVRCRFECRHHSQPT